MKILSKFTKFLHSASFYFEDYKILQIKLNGGLTSLYKDLNLPWIRELEISTILDIGANTGQSTVALSKLLPNAKIYAFEPIPECFVKLEKRFENNQNVQTLNLGLGADSGEIMFEKNEFSPSSSFLKMTDIHKKAFPFTEKSQEIAVKIEKLDLIAKSLDLQGNVMAKIDVQGYEDRVISGGEDTLKKCQVIIIETSFDELYVDQPLFPEIHQRLSKLGFSYKGSLGQLCSPETGKILQADSIFIRN
jgi:FkbM family methyltransferase